MLDDTFARAGSGAMAPMAMPGMRAPLTNAQAAAATAAYVGQLRASWSASTSLYAARFGALRACAGGVVDAHGMCARYDDASVRSQYVASREGDAVGAAATFARRMMMYQRTAYDTLGQYYANEARVIRDARATCAQSPMGRIVTQNVMPRDDARGGAGGRVESAGDGERDANASQKQWPIVPQVSTAICPPKSDLVRSTPPGTFGRPQAVNAGVQEACAAKTKAKKAAAEENASAKEDSRSSRDDPEAAAAAAAAAAEAVVKRVNEAKALLDPAAASYRGDVRLPSRARRSSAPSPESSLGAPDVEHRLEQSDALGSKGSKSAAA